MFDNQRGITPLVATVLLVAFSVGLGALVMSWGEEYIADHAEFTQGTSEVKNTCDLAKIDVIRIAGQMQACLAPDGIQVWIDNGADVDLVGIHARIAGSKGIDTKDNILLAPLLKANAARAIIAYDPTLTGDVLQVKLTPKIFENNQLAICSQNAITLERLKPCI